MEIDTVEGGVERTAASTSTSSHAQIQDALKSALIFDPGYDGSFFFVKTYGPGEAQNPVMRLNQFGFVGLPFTASTAYQISPAGLLREIQDYQMSFRNPLWHTFLLKVFADVNASLGLEKEAGKPEWVFSHLKLSMAGSHSRNAANNSFEAKQGVLATLILVLPAETTGEPGKLSHRGAVKAVDTSSLHSTTAIAWYRAVTFELGPLTTGARIILEYHLKKTDKIILPAFVTAVEKSPELEHILVSWGSKPYSAPKIMVHLFQGAYSRNGLAANGLCGNDRLTVQAFYVATQRHPFQVALAILVHRVVARRRAGELGFGGTTRMTKIETIVDLEGNLRCKGLLLSGEDPVPQAQDHDFSYLWESLEADARFTEEMRDGQYERRYERSVLLVLPNIWWGRGRLQSRPSLSWALQKLDCILVRGGGTPSQRTVDFILDAVDHGDLPVEDVLSSLCAVACAKRDGALWCRVFDKCLPNLLERTMELSELEEALAIFGTDLILPRLETIFEPEHDVSARLTLLEQFGDMGTVPADWLAVQRDRIFSDIHALLPSDVKAVIRVAYWNNGHILDVLNQLNLDNLGPETMLELAKVMHLVVAENGLYRTRRDEARRMQAFVGDILYRLVTTIDLREIYGPGLQDNTAEFAYQCILACVETGNQYLLEAVSEQLAEISTGPIGVILPSLLEKLDPLLQSFPPSVLPAQCLRKFYKAASLGFIQQIDKENPSSADISILLRPTMLSGDGTFIEEILTPQIHQLASHLGLVKAFVQQLMGLSIHVTPSSSTSLTSLISDILASTVEAVNLAETDPNIIMDLVRLCRAHGEETCIKTLFHRAADDFELDSDLWLDVLGDLADPTLENPCNISREPYRPFAGVAILHASEDLGRKPHSPVVEAARTLQCDEDINCNRCQSLRSFFQSSEDVRYYQGVGRSSVEHIVHQLEKLPGGRNRKIANWEIDDSVPQGIKITKSGTNDLLAWEGKQRLLVNRLRRLSKSDRDLKMMCGEEEWKDVKYLLGVGSLLN